MSESDGAKLLKILRQRHPKWERYEERAFRPTYRACMGDIKLDAVKRSFLPHGDFEKPEHYDLRVELTVPRPALPGVVSRFHGAIFKKPATVDYKSADLAEWAKNVDGMGTTLLKAVEGVADEATGVGGVFFYVDRSVPNPEKMATAGLKPEDLTTKDVLERVDGWRPVLVKFPVESVINWDVDRSGRPLWVVIEHIVSEQSGPLSGRSSTFEWIAMDRKSVRIFRAAVETKKKLTGQKDKSGVDLAIDVMEPSTEVREITLAGGTPHGCGMVPLAFLPGREIGPFEADSIFPGTAAADIARIREDSVATFARHLHGVPLLVAWLASSRNVDDVVRDQGTAWKLDPEKNERVEYVTTPGDSLEHFEDVLARLEKEGYRHGNTDPAGMSDGDSTPESGRKARYRMQATEGRELRSFSTNLALFTRDLCELAARRMSPVVVPVDQTAFGGTIKYPEKFDEAEIRELQYAFAELKHEIRSPTLWRVVAAELASALAGDVTPEVMAKILAEVEAQEVKFVAENAPDPVV